MSDIWFGIRREEGAPAAAGAPGAAAVLPAVGKKRMAEFFAFLPKLQQRGINQSAEEAVCNIIG